MLPVLQSYTFPSASLLVNSQHRVLQHYCTANIYQSLEILNSLHEGSSFLHVLPPTADTLVCWDLATTHLSAVLAGFPAQLSLIALAEQITMLRCWNFFYSKCSDDNLLN